MGLWACALTTTVCCAPKGQAYPPSESYARRTHGRGHPSAWSRGHYNARHQQIIWNPDSDRDKESVRHVSSRAGMMMSGFWAWRWKRHDCGLSHQASGFAHWVTGLESHGVAQIFRAGGWFNGLAARIHYRGSTLSNQRDSNQIARRKTRSSQTQAISPYHPVCTQPSTSTPGSLEAGNEPLVDTLPQQQPTNANGDQPPFGISDFTIFIGPLPCRTVAQEMARHTSFRLSSSPRLGNVTISRTIWTLTLDSEQTPAALVPIIEDSQDDGPNKWQAWKDLVRLETLHRSWPKPPNGSSWNMQGDANHWCAQWRLLYTWEECGLPSLEGWGMFGVLHRYYEASQVVCVSFRNLVHPGRGCLSLICMCHPTFQLVYLSVLYISLVWSAPTLLQLGAFKSPFAYIATHHIPIMSRTVRYISYQVVEREHRTRTCASTECANPKQTARDVETGHVVPLPFPPTVLPCCVAEVPRFYERGRGAVDQRGRTCISCHLLFFT